MGEESSDCRDDMDHESRKLDTGVGGAMNVEELLRMLEAAVEKEFVGMKKTCEGLGATSEYMQPLKKDETTSSSSAGTPNSMYSACSASGSFFSRCSYGKEKNQELPYSTDEAIESSSVERHEAFEINTKTKKEATSRKERLESTLGSAQENQLHDVCTDAVLESSPYKSEYCNDVNTNISKPEVILGNFQSMIQAMVNSDTHHLQKQTAAELSTSEVRGGLHDMICDRNLSISSQDSVENEVAAVCNLCGPPLASKIETDSDATIISSTKRCETLVPSDLDKFVVASRMNLDADASSDLKGHDKPVTPLNTGEMEMEASSCGNKGLSPNLTPRDEPDVAFGDSIERVEGVVFAIRDLYNEFASQARTSLLEAIRTLDGESPKFSDCTDEKLEGGLTDFYMDNFLAANGNDQSSSEEIVKPSNTCSKFQGCGSLPEGHQISTGESKDRSWEPGWKDREDSKVKEKVQTKHNRGAGEACQVNLKKLNTRSIDEEELIKPNDLFNHLVKSNQDKSAPRVLGRVLEEMLVEPTDHGAVERSITAYEYLQEYGWDESNLTSVSDLIQTHKEHHFFVRPELKERSSKNRSKNRDDEVSQASKCTSDYRMGLQQYNFDALHKRIAQDPSVEPVCRITSATERGQASSKDSRSEANAYRQDQKFGNDNDVTEHVVGFGSNCCTPSRRRCGLGVLSRPCCNDRMLVRDSSHAFQSTNQSDSIRSTSTFLGMERAVSSCALGINSEKFADWNKAYSKTLSDSYNESPQSAPSDTFYVRLLRYGRSVTTRRSTSCTPVSRALRESSVLSKLAGEVTERTNSESSTPAHFEGCNYREKVKVVVRMRPFAEHEKMCPLKQILCLPEDKVIVKENNLELFKQSCTRSKELRDIGWLEYKVDNVLDDSYLQKHRCDKKAESQNRMYELIGLPCLEYALDGYNTTIIAYGQVGSGKTFTMMGDDTEEGRGLMPRLAEELMNHINTEFRNEFVVQVSYLEIYQETIRDLLVPSKVDRQNVRAEWQGCADSSSGSVNSERRWSDSLDNDVDEESMDCDTASYLSFGAGTSTSSRRAPSVCFDYPSTKKESLKVREHPVLGPYVEGLMWKDIYTWHDMEQIMLEGAARRTLGPTPSNKFSNRGHTLFTIRLFKEHGGRSSNMRLINLVDLAGTERPNLAKRVSLERLEESRYINRSIAHLNDVILNLSNNSKFVSYRNSSLTKLLRESLGGSYKTFLIAHLSPAEQDFQESVNTLRYAAKASQIQGTITAHTENKRRLLVKRKTGVKALHELVQNEASNKEDDRREHELLSLGSRFPILSSFKVPRVETPVNSEHDYSL